MTTKKPFRWTKRRQLLGMLLREDGFKNVKRRLIGFVNDSCMLQDASEVETAMTLAYWMRELVLVSRQIEKTQGNLHVEKAK